MGATTRQGAYIDLDGSALRLVEEGDEVQKEKKGFFAAIWFSLSRFVRRTIMRSKRRMHKMLNSMPPKWRTAIRFAAGVFGWFCAWMLFYASIIIAFSFGLTAGFLTVGVWCLIYGFVIATLAEA